MPTAMNNNGGRSLPLSYRIFSLAAILLIALMVAGTFFALANTSKKAKADNVSFTFTTTGDYGEGTNTPAVLKAIGSSGASFHMALGDLNYDYPTVTAQQWISYLQTNLGSNPPPFDWVAGDHDYGKNGKAGDVSDLEKYLPNQISNINISGTYGEEYSFDYPATNPLARFIMISPVVTTKYNYNQGGTDYNWVKNKIDSAKNQGLWIIVGMAAGCVYIFSSSDSSGCNDGDLFNLLVSENVLVLQAHIHNYQRSNQFAFNNSCTNPPGFPTYDQTGSVKAACVGSPTNNYTQSNGTVVVNDGTGGKNLVNFISGDARDVYFNKWAGASKQPTYGYSQFTVSANQISMQFVPVVGSFKDSFTISNSNPTPTPSPSPSPSVSPSVTPSPTASPSPSVTPTSTPGTSIGQDDFTRNDQLLWGTASDGNKWGADANNLSNNFAIASNTGQVTGSGTNATSYTGVLGATATNAEVVTSGSLSSFGGNTLGAVLRWADNNDFYKAYITGTNLVISKKVGGTVTKIKSVSFTATAATLYTIDFSVVGTTLTASAWPSSDPTKSVTVSTTDSSLSSGQCGVLVYLTSGIIANFDSFVATSR